MKPKLLWLSDINCQSGFGTVAENLLKYLQVKYDVVAAGWNFDPNQKHEKPWKWHYAIKGPNYDKNIHMRDVVHRIREIVLDVKPDVIITFADPWDFLYVSNEFTYGDEGPFEGIRKFYPRAKIIGYLSADAFHMPSWVKECLAFYDAIAVPSEFSKKVLQEISPHSPIEVIYHGIDPDIYHPFSQDSIQFYRRELGIQPNEFIIGFNGRNQFRKNIPGLLRAFQKFNNLVPNSKLLFMTDINASSATHELKALISRLGIGCKIILPGEFGPRSNITDEKMACYYNCMDVYMSLAYCEGYGIPVHEAMACGVPVIHTGYSAPVELIEKSEGGFNLDVKGFINEKASDRDFAVADEDQAVEYLKLLYEDPKIRAEMGRKAALWASKHTWLEKAKDFNKLIDKTLKQPRISIFPIMFGFEVIK